MISVIVCSSNPDLRAKFEYNLASTIGCAYELIYRDNRIDPKGICSVYNQLATQSKYEFLCFVHEDVSFETVGWGEILIKKAQDVNVGVLGFSGAVNVSGKPYWFDEVRGQRFFVQRLRSGELFYDFTSQDFHAPYQVVNVLDGMFLFCRKEVWQQIKFDDLNFKGFHLYDIDFSFHASRYYTNYIVKTVTISHYSLGSLGKEYYSGLIDFYKKWIKELPLVTVESSLMSYRVRYMLIIEMMRDVKLSTPYIYNYLDKINEIKNLKDIVFTILALIKVKFKIMFKKGF